MVECPLSLDQQVLEIDDAYEINATVVNSAMLNWWLWRFGDAVSEITKIVQPALEPLRLAFMKDA